MDPLVRELANEDAVHIEHFQIIERQQTLQGSDLSLVLCLGRNIKVIRDKGAPARRDEKENDEGERGAQKSGPKALKSLVLIQPTAAQEFAREVAQQNLAPPSQLSRGKSAGSAAHRHNA